MSIKLGQTITIVDPADSSAKATIVTKLNAIGFIADGIQFKGDGVEYMQGIGHWTARYVEKV